MNEGLSRRALQSGQPASLSRGRDEPVSGRPPPSAHASPPGVPRLTTTTGTGPGATVCRTPLPGGAQVGAQGSGAGGGGDLLGGVRAELGWGVLSCAHPTAGLGAGGVGSGEHPPTHKAGSHPLWGPQSCSGYCWGHTTPCWSGWAQQGQRGPRAGNEAGDLLRGPGRSRGSVLPVGVQLSGCRMRSQRPLPRF